MATLAHVTDHADQAVSRLLEPYRVGASMPALVRALSRQLQELEDVLWDVGQLRRLELATGAQLDLLGRVVGQPREGRSDEVYRLWLRARMRLALGSGGAEDILELFRMLMQGSTSIELEEQFPAGLVLRIDPSAIIDPSAAAAILDLAKAAGVRAILEAGTSVDTTSFAFDPNGAGFGDATNPSVGGTFATAI